MRWYGCFVVSFVLRYRPSASWLLRKDRQIPENKLRGSYFSKAVFEGLIFGGTRLRFQIDWGNLIAGSKFTVFAFFCFVFEGNDPRTSSRGAYIWRGVFSEFYGISWNIVNRRDWLWARQTSKEQTKIQRFMLEDPRPGTIFCFVLIHCTWIT